MNPCYTPSVRARALGIVLLGLVTAGLSIAACSSKGNGVGSAPPQPPGCPATPPAAGSACTAAQVCAYDLPCDGELCHSGLVASCGFGDGGVWTWAVETRTDGGVFADANVDTLLPDTADASSDVDAASDAPDADAATDTLDDTATAADTLADTTSATDADAESDTADSAVTLPDLGVDVGLGD